jgi:hypothetical protein
MLAHEFIGHLTGDRRPEQVFGDVSQLGNVLDVLVDLGITPADRKHGGSDTDHQGDELAGLQERLELVSVH